MATNPNRNASTYGGQMKWNMSKKGGNKGSWNLLHLYETKRKIFAA